MLHIHFQVNDLSMPTPCQKMLLATSYFSMGDIRQSSPSPWTASLDLRAKDAVDLLVRPVRQRTNRLRRVLASTLVLGAVRWAVMAAILN